MEPVSRVRDYLLDNVGHMTYPGHPSYDAARKRWFVPILCSMGRGAIVVGDIELDADGHIVFAPSRDELVARLAEAAASAS